MKVLTVIPVVPAMLLLASAGMTVNVRDGQTAEIAQSPFAGPIVITYRGTYRGNWESTDPATYAVRVSTSEPVVIEMSRIRSKGTGIWTRVD
jgi:hypothetical protein